ncbi:MAG TPA: HAMP domain-containing protein [Usitatibacteraceae bacterium]|nr:HAMP domain-containing protein [Usitatibacteraceae bacterium]
MGLRLKFNLILVAIFAAGFLTLAMVSWRYLEQQAVDDAQRAAQTVLDASSFGNLDPRLASSVGSRLVEMKIREFGLNDIASGVEGQALLRLKNTASSQLSDVFSSSGGERRLVVARIHPGSEGAVRVRMAVVDLAPIVDMAKIAVTTLMSSIGAVFVAIFVVLNIMLDRMIVRPVSEMAVQANAVSVGDFSVPEFVPKSSDEIGVMGVAFNRMRRSTEEAIKLLKNAKF